VGEKRKYIFFLFLILSAGLEGCCCITPPVSRAPTPPPPSKVVEPAPEPAQSDPIVIAVMPFSNITGQKDHDWLSIGMSEVFTTKLGRITVFQLVERNKLSEALKEIELGQTGLIDESTAPKAGEMMGAEQLVTGSFQVMGPDIRIDSRLMEVETTKILVTAGATGELEKIFEVQDKIIVEFLSSMDLPLTEEEANELKFKPTSSLEAFKLYSRAVDTHSPEGKTLNDDQRIALLDQSTGLDPNFFLAFGALGDVYMERKKDYALAAVNYNRVVVLQPNYVAPAQKLIAAYEKGGNTKAAAEERKRVESIRKPQSAQTQQIQAQQKQAIQKQREQRKKLKEEKGEAKTPEKTKTQEKTKAPTKTKKIEPPTKTPSSPSKSPAPSRPSPPPSYPKKR